MVSAPYRTIHPDMGLWRVLEETTRGHFKTIATYATDAEAKAFLEGLAHAAGEDQAHSTYSRALEATR